MTTCISSTVNIHCNLDLKQNYNYEDDSSDYDSHFTKLGQRRSSLKSSDADSIQTFSKTNTNISFGEWQTYLYLLYGVVRIFKFFSTKMFTCSWHAGWNGHWLFTIIYSLYSHRAIECVDPLTEIASPDYCANDGKIEIHCMMRRMHNATLTIQQTVRWAISPGLRQPKCQLVSTSSSQEENYAWDKWYETF